MSFRALLLISRESWSNRNPNSFHRLMLLKLMLGIALLGISLTLYVTAFVRAKLDHIFVLQSLMWVICLISYLRVRHARQVYQASLFIVTLLTALLLTILISSRLGDISGAYHHVVTILVATSFLLGPRFALPYYLLFLGLYIAIGSGLWHVFFPDTIPEMHPSRASLYIDRIIEITCAFGLAFMFDRLKISQQARLKEQEQEVAKKEKQLSINRMAGGIAHEINNPLTILLGYLEILERHDFNRKDLERINPRIQMAAKRIQFVVWSLNQVNSGGSTKGGNALLNVAILHVQVRIRDLNPNLTLNIDTAEGIKVRLATEDLQNILYTLLENAVEALASKADGMIKLTVALVGEFVLIEVWDNGEDVNIDDLQKFTEPFYTTKLDRPGRGMGLTLSAAIIRATGGQLVYKREGSWTIAAMTLPGYDSTVLYAS